MMRYSLRASELFSNAHVAIGCDYGQRILVVTRKPQPFDGVEDIDRVRQQFSTAIPDALRGTYSVLNDYRLAPLRVHPSLEPAFGRLRAETERGFMRSAVVVATKVGGIRSERLGVAASIPVLVSQSFEDALAFLLRG
jgi:hypothetical protein